MAVITGTGYSLTNSEFDELNHFLSVTYKLWGGLHNWSLNRFGNWNYADVTRRRENPEFYLNNLHVWRNGAGNIVGFCVSENGRYMFLQSHPEYRYVEEYMLAWTEAVWGSSRDCIGVVAWDNDDFRRAKLRERGYIEERSLGFVRRYDTTSSYRIVPLFEGFRLTTLAQLAPAAYIDAVNDAFGRGGSLDRAWFEANHRAPGFSRDWVVCAAAPDGRCASFADVRIDYDAGYAEIDPVGTIPEFQRMGLATAVLMECFRRLRSAGIPVAYIGSGAEPYWSNRLYDGCNPVEKREDILWVKEVGAA